jgi:hypothetical protein
MTYDDYLAAVGVAKVDHREWRPGQTAFNVLHQVRPDLAGLVQGSVIDPFFINDNLLDFYRWVKTNWETSPG